MEDRQWMYTGDLHKLPQEPPVGEGLPRPAVVCAAGGGCDHRGCSGGPFIVAFIVLEDLSSEFDAYLNDDDETTDEDEDETTDEDDDEDDGSQYVDAHACFYESDTGEFAGVIDIHLAEGRYGLDDSPAALVGDSLYFLCTPGGILRYRYGLLRRLGGKSWFTAGVRECDVLSMMELPRWEHLGIGKNPNDVVVMAAEGGGLGLACLCPKTSTMLYLLARDTEGAVGDDATAWVQRRVIDLKTLLPVGNPKMKPFFRGIAQDANVIFVSTEDGIFSVGLGSSLQVKKVCENGAIDNYWMYPFVSFYTESLLLKLASGKLPAPVGNQ